MHLEKVQGTIGKGLGVPSPFCVYVELSRGPSKDGKCSSAPDVDMDSFISASAGMSDMRLTWGIVVGFRSFEL